MHLKSPLQTNNPTKPFGLLGLLAQKRLLELSNDSLGEPKDQSPHYPHGPQSLIPLCCPNTRVGHGRAAAKDGCYQKMARCEDPSGVTAHGQPKDQSPHHPHGPQTTQHFKSRSLHAVQTRLGQGRAAAKDGCYQKMPRCEGSTRVFIDEFVSPKVWPHLGAHG